jgi:hypothetical protein
MKVRYKGFLHTLAETESSLMKKKTYLVYNLFMSEIGNRLNKWITRHLTCESMRYTERKTLNLNKCPYKKKHPELTVIRL